jgi:hypothetical protein
MKNVQERRLGGQTISAQEDSAYDSYLTQVSGKRSAAAKDMGPPLTGEEEAFFKAHDWPKSTGSSPWDKVMGVSDMIAQPLNAIWGRGLEELTGGDITKEDYWKAQGIAAAAAGGGALADALTGGNNVASTAGSTAGGTVANQNLPSGPQPTDPEIVYPDVTTPTPATTDPTPVVVPPVPGGGGGGGAPVVPVPGGGGGGGAPVVPVPGGGGGFNWNTFWANMIPQITGGLGDYFGAREVSRAETDAYNRSLTLQQQAQQQYAESLTPESRFAPEQLQAQQQWRTIAQALGTQFPGMKSTPVGRSIYEQNQALQGQIDANVPVGGGQWQEQINANLAAGASPVQGQISALLNRPIDTGSPQTLTEQLRPAKRAELGRMQGEMLGTIGQQKAASQAQLSNTMRGLYGDATPGLQAAMGGQIERDYMGPELQAQQWEADQARFEKEQERWERQFADAQRQQSLQNLMAERGYGTGLQQQTLQNLLGERSWGAGAQQQTLQNLMAERAFGTAQQQQAMQNLQQYAQAPIGNLPQGYTEPLFPPVDYSQANLYSSLTDIAQMGIGGILSNYRQPAATTPQNTYTAPSPYNYGYF